MVRNTPRRKTKNLEDETSLGMAELLESHRRRVHVITPIEKYDFPTTYSEGVNRGFYYDEEP